MRLKSVAIPNRGEGTLFLPSERRASEFQLAGRVDDLTHTKASGRLHAVRGGLDPLYVVLKFGGGPALYAKVIAPNHEFAFDLTVDVFRDAVLRQIAQRLNKRSRVSLAALSAVRLALEFEVADRPGTRLAVPNEVPIERSGAEWLDFLDADPEAVEAFRRAQWARPGLTPRCEIESGSAKFIAFYLPQFHPIPENDAAWGPGFTEWTGVANNKPQYPDHAAPSLPADLGYYDLRLREVRQQQGELAKAYGIYGFCYYFYWFSGRRLLERPLELMLRERAPDLPFCLCWANEPWSRRWDGSTNELLVAQGHDKASDLSILQDLLPFFADDRYIRIDGKPLFLIYRMSLMSDPSGFIEELRAAAVRSGLPGLFLCNAMTFGDTDGRIWGCDAAVEFPPHNLSAVVIPKDKVGAFEGYQGDIFDYVQSVQRCVARRPPEFPHFPGVMTGWDNTARKRERGNIFHGATPELFEIWLRRASQVSLARNRQAPLVFINAWNEWGEGAHLEPDYRFGRAFLESVQRVSAGSTVSLADAGPSAVRDGTPAADLTELRRELSLERRENAIITRHLHSILPLTAPDPLFSGEPTTIRSLQRVRSEARNCSIDFVNGRQVCKMLAFRGQGRTLIQGWLCGDMESGVDPTTIAFFVVRRIPDAQTYHAVILDRLSRPDVALVFELPDEAAFAGFSIDVDFSTVEPGTYDISLIEIRGAVAVEIRAERMLVVS
jgi:hypothetical protein